MQSQEINHLNTITMPLAVTLLPLNDQMPRLNTVSVKLIEPGNILKIMQAIFLSITTALNQISWIASSIVMQSRVALGEKSKVPEAGQVYTLYFVVTKQSDRDALIEQSVWYSISSQYKNSL